MPQLVSNLGYNELVFNNHKQEPKRKRSSIVFFHRSSQIKHRKLKFIPPGIKKPKVLYPALSIAWYGLEIGLFYLIVLMIVFFVSPTKIANIPLTNAYLLFHFPLFCANLLLLYVITRQWLIVYILTISLQTLIFLKLQNVAISWLVWATLFTTIIIFVGITRYSLYNKRHYAG